MSTGDFPSPYRLQEQSKLKKSLMEVEKGNRRAGQVGQSRGLSVDAVGKMVPSGNWFR